MSSFVLKLIACICMLFDHMGKALYPDFAIFSYIGRFSFTIFAFQIVQGYLHTHDIKKYVTRLFIFALISQTPFMLFYYKVFHTLFAINVIFTLLFGLLVILIYDKYNKFVGISSLLLLGSIAELCHFDYGFFGVFIIFMFYILRDKKISTLLVFVVSVFARYLFTLFKNGLSISYFAADQSYLFNMMFTFLSIIPVLLYNGKKGKDAKYLFYIFYPTHLLLLAVLSSWGIMYL